MIRYFIRRDGSKVLQYQDCRGTWVDVPEIDEVHESRQMAMEQELKELEDEKIRERLKGKTYTIRK